MAIFPRGKIYWYKFYFAGQLIRESSKSTSKTVAKNAENQRRRELEQGFNNLQNRRENRVRRLRDVADEYLADYRLRFRGITFAEYAIGHVVRLLGDALLVDIDESTVLKYQTDRLSGEISVSGQPTQLWEPRILVRRDKLRTSKGSHRDDMEICNRPRKDSKIQGD